MLTAGLRWIVALGTAKGVLSKTNGATDRSVALRDGLCDASALRSLVTLRHVCALREDGSESRDEDGVRTEQEVELFMRRPGVKERCLHSLVIRLNWKLIVADSARVLGLQQSLEHAFPFQRSF